jgi:hypothetical protein
MDKKYSPTTQKEIDNISQYLDQWSNLFSLEINYYIEGWSICLREMTIYPRFIVIFKPYDQKSYSIKSFEIHYDQTGNEHFKDLYFIGNIISVKILKNEIRNKFYGKVILKSVVNEKFKT